MPDNCLALESTAGHTPNVDHAPRGSDGGPADALRRLGALSSGGSPAGERTEWLRQVSNHLRRLYDELQAAGGAEYPIVADEHSVAEKETQTGGDAGDDDALETRLDRFEIARSRLLAELWDTLFLLDRFGTSPELSLDWVRARLDRHLAGIAGLKEAGRELMAELAAPA